MTRNKLGWFWCLPAVAIICLVYLYSHRFIAHSDIVAIACVYVVVETVVLVVALSILRKLNMLTSWKVIAYYVVVVGGIMAMSSLLSSLEIHVGVAQQAKFFLFSILSVFMVLFFLNFGLLAIIVDTRFWKACLIGTIMSLINTFMVMMATTVSP